MPLETQAKILRVLQEQRFARLGGDTRVEVDVRVIASTNRSCKGEMAAGRFREDLFYRLNVVPLAMPALAERRIDIPELAGTSCTGAARHAGLPPRRSPTRRWPSCRPATGRATCASCATRSSGC